MTKLSTVRDVVDTVGRQRMMAALGVGTSSISNYLKAGRFPNRASVLLALRRTLADDGLDIDERLFGDES